MNKRLLVTSIFALIMQMHATPEITLINEDPSDCRLPNLIITYNDTVIRLSPGEQTTIPQDVQNFNVLRPLTNVMATNKYYKFQITLTSNEPTTANNALKIGSHSLVSFDKEAYLVTLNELTLSVKRDSELVQFNQ